ncbi:hypothetical protein ECL_02476 [Enterobacter cloacae subsp. cloacae ATCC 13047]|nr:hypothetical protein ECL_02476 [Enterobacter cloacae subsp. cloacae ATCC 13047]
MMSGTATPNDFSGIEFNKVYKINKPSEARKVISTVDLPPRLDTTLS